MSSGTSDIPKLFGTDGIRGPANIYPMTANLVLRVGQAMGYILRTSHHKKNDHPMVLIGKDTRLSGYMLEQALASGLNSMGIQVNLTGPLPTPGIGFLAQNMRASAGIIISASHNSFEDNGIKVFGSDGFKIPSEVERKIEQLVYENQFDKLTVKPNIIGRTRRIDDAAGRYIVYAKHTFPLQMTLDDLRIVLDCANGAAYKVAPAIFQELGAEVILIGNQPNGYNINENSGALFPEKTSEAVRKYDADVGITLDGDADRVIMVDELGHVVNGDHILAICAIDKLNQNKLSGQTVVTTPMGNLGLERALKRYNIKTVRSDVGDKHVIQKMRDSGYVLGGEPSGHIICLDHSTTGDGCIAALSVLAVMRQKNQKLSELNKIVTDVPQTLMNIKVKHRRNLNEVPGYPEMIESVHQELGDRGRVFLRFSGTEPLLRILVEGEEKVSIEAIARKISNFLETHLNYEHRI